MKTKMKTLMKKTVVKNYDETTRDENLYENYG